MTEYIQVLTTTETKEDAVKIAKSVTQQRLAGCVQIVGPITSTYWWKGNLEVAEEWLCLIKTERGLYEALERAVKDIHPYETPEIMAMPVVEGNGDYLTWLSGELKR